MLILNNMIDLWSNDEILSINRAANIDRKDRIWRFLSDQWSRFTRRGMSWSMLKEVGGEKNGEDASRSVLFVVLPF